MSLMAVVLLAGLMFATNAQAQGGTLEPAPSTPSIKTTGVWLASSSALEALETELNGSINQALETLPPSGQQYIIWKFKAELYEGVYESILRGTSVEKAVRINFDRLAGAKHAEPVISALSQAEWQDIFNEIVDLLTT